MTAVLPPFAYTIEAMPSDPDATASPRPQQSRRNPNKQTRPQQHPYQHESREALSDSNLATSNRTDSRKTPKTARQTERAASITVQQPQKQPQTHHTQKRAASAQPQNSNLAATPAKPIYAGAAFHASPAPSSLPVPKFFAKSVPASTGDGGFQAQIERDRNYLSADSTTGMPVSPQRSAVKSPLDMFFAADRQEKAQKSAVTDGRPRSANSHSETPSKAPGIFSLEMDDTSSPSASRNGTPSVARRSPYPVRPQSVQNAENDATASLKAFLNITSSGSAQITPAAPMTPSRSPYMVSPQQHLQTPARPQDPSLHYGNRNLSPLFHAASAQSARYPSSPQTYNPTTATGPSHPAGFSPLPHTTTPVRSGPAPAMSPYQHHHDQAYPSSYNLAARRSPQPIATGPNGYGPDQNDVKSMEDRLKGMLKLK